MLRSMCVFLAATALFGADSPDLRWMPVKSAHVEIAGLPWFQENHDAFWRLPARSQDKFPVEVWRLAQSPAGGRIRFRTDSSSLALRLEWPSPPGMNNMHAFGQSGVDLYVGNFYWGTAVPDKEAKPGKIYSHVYFEDLPKSMRDITIYLATYSPVTVLEIGLSKDATVEAARGFAVAKPVVFYGTSITQGGCVSHPGMSYESIVGRKLNLDHVNLGFSGSGKGEPDVARAVAEIDAAVFVLDFAQNNRTVESLTAAYDPFLAVLRAQHPNTPIVAITPIYSTNETAGSRRNDEMRALIRRVISQRIAAGDTNLQLLEGTDLLGPARVDGLVDGTHPNDLGAYWMAEGVADRLRKVLGL